ncbi:hypothetical protein AAEO56_10425 [Flavobacterium sp. DGU11]|uniref:Uncharacterized protein n=1 Tax=Flavobacterium arundinis TaxID=3139143 RepID=A0ABU9HXH0_9FLAO
MQYIDGIPLITDPEGDAVLFGSLFPQGFAQSQTAFQNVRRTPILDYEWQFLKRSVDDTHDALFMVATPETIGNVTLQQEPGTQVDFRKEDFTLYHEGGVSNGRYDPGIDIIDATVSVIVLKDGVLAEKLWKETSVESNQAIFFIENNESDWSSAKMFARFGEFAKKKLLALDRGNSMLMEFLRSLPEVDNDVIQQLLNHGQVETKVSLVKKTVTGIMKIVSYAAGGPGKIVGPWCEKAGNYILENIQVPESVWNSQSDDYSKREKLQEKLMLGNDLSGLLASFNDSILLMPVRYVAPELLNRLKKGAEQFLAEFVAEYNSMVSDALKKMFGETGSDEEPDLSFLREYTAYLCGICNGLIDFVGGTLVFAGQLMQFQFDFAQDADAYLERFDSFMASVKPFFAKILAAVKKAFANPKKYFSKFDTTDINWDKVAYCAGYTGAFIASFFIPFTAFAKPAAVAAKLKKAAVPTEMLAEISAKTAKVSKFVMDGSRRAAGQMLEFLDDILKLMALGLEELTAFLDDIFKKMAEWLMKNKKVVQDKADEVAAYIKRIKPVKFPTFTMLKKYISEETGKGWCAPDAVKYLTEAERLEYELAIIDGKLYTKGGKLFDTAAGSTIFGPQKAIFVMDSRGRIYASLRHKARLFHHSSFLAGGAVASAGEIEVVQGLIKLVTRKSGHYQPSSLSNTRFLRQLESKGVKTKEIIVKDF